MLCVEYEKGLYFYQDDIDEFLKTKAAAYTMVEYMFRESGILWKSLGHFMWQAPLGNMYQKNLPLQSVFIRIGQRTSCKCGKLLT